MSEAEAARLVEAYVEGVNTSELCETWGINRDTLYEHLKRAEVLPSRYKLDPADVERAAELYGRGLSLKSVGDEFGVDAKTIRRALAREGVAIRPRPGWSTSPS